MFLFAVTGSAVAQPQSGSIRLAYRVEILPPLAGYDSVFPTDLGDAGRVIANAGTDPYDPLAAPIEYRKGRPVELPRPTDSLNFALGLGGKLVAGTSSNFPVVWIAGAARPLQPAGGLSPGYAFDANSGCQVCGAVINDFFGEQFPAYWPNADSEGVLLPVADGSPQGSAFAINDLGHMAGAAGGVSGGFYGARWDDPAQPPLQIGPLPGAFNAELLAINAHGDCAGRSSFEDGSTQAFVYIDATRQLIGLGHLNGNYSYANALNDSRVVVGTASDAGAAHAFVWRDGLMRDLNDLVVSSNQAFEYLSNAVAIDSRGRILAEAVTPARFGTVTRAALLTPLGPVNVGRP